MPKKPGNANPDKRKLEALAIAKKINLKIFLRVCQLRAKRPKPRNIFGLVGQELRPTLSSESVRQRFYEHKNFYFGEATELYPKRPAKAKKDT